MVEAEVALCCLALCCLALCYLALCYLALSCLPLCRTTLSCLALCSITLACCLYLPASHIAVAPVDSAIFEQQYTLPSFHQGCQGTSM